MTEKGLLTMNGRYRRSQGGQTIVVALIVLGLLLILGFVFLGLINRSIGNSSRFQARTVAADLAEGGIRYAHEQLQRSPQGADWRGEPEANLSGRDPDAAYLRVGTGFPVPGTANVADLGGPDGLGPFIRVNLENGRALVRVRYAPSEANIFEDSPTGPLRNPGVVRNYLVIESIGRPGRVDPRDPTTLNPVDYPVTGFADAGAFAVGFNQLRSTLDVVNSRILTAFVPLALTDTARFITNKYNVSRAAEFGIPADLGTAYRVDTNVPAPIPVGTNLSAQLGMAELETAAGSVVQGRTGFGSLHSNADLTLFGNVNAYMSGSLGDQITIAGSLRGAPGAQLNIFRTDFTRNPFTWQPTQTFNLAGGAIDSRDPNFNTANGIVRDGVPQPDQNGFARGVGRKVPPSILPDPETRIDRYVEMTRESGNAANGVNNGRFGHGEGIYVDNASDLQSPSSEAGRQAVPGSRSLVYEWLNPNAPDTKNWFGPFYAPPAAELQFRHDGFIITRDSRGPVEERFWRRPDGTSTNSTSIRYRIGRGDWGTDGRVRIVNSFTPGLANIDASLGFADYANGPVFNGVLYFAGNVRVRGTIPTDVQLTVVSGGTIYIDGSVTKGTVSNFVTSTYINSNPEAPTPEGQDIDRASRSALALMAKDYVAVNTTMFFGPSTNSQLQSGPDANSVRLRQDEALSLRSEFVRSPLSPLNPFALAPISLQYRDALTNTQLSTLAVFTHAMGNEAADRTFMAMNVNPGWFDTPTVTSTYLFPNVATNAASPSYQVAPIPATIPIYGLGIESWQRYPKYESIAFDLIDPLTAAVAPDTLTATNATGQFRLFTKQPNELRMTPVQLDGNPSNDYLLSRVLLTPHDIKVEAMIYAEEGSFFVIPGPWFNPNANDRRDAYLARVEALVTSGETPADARAIADDERRSTFGSSPETPFFGEPVDVKITVLGAVSENMPPSMAEQAEWIRKWGWIPARQGATTRSIPGLHVPPGQDLNALPIAPNIVIAYDPVLGSGRSQGFVNLTDDRGIVRRDDFGRPLPAVPRLPVSPALSYFGELN